MTHENYSSATFYDNGFRQGKRIAQMEPGLRGWYERMARASLSGPYASHRPYRAYQTGFARGVRS